MEAYIRFVLGEPELARIYLVLAVNGSLTDPGIAKTVARHHEARLERFSEALRRDRPTLAGDEVAERIEALLAALNGYTMHWVMDPSFDFAGHARRLLKMEPATPAEEPA